jgi:UDP-GlcNAc:undecaprenyl-phosphate GlcNAc-1-phosphate transferase
LYQITQRSGTDARIVALLHWGFVVIGGLTAILFLAVGRAWKLPVLLLPLIVQFCWAIYVIHHARRANLSNW